MLKFSKRSNTLYTVARESISTHLETHLRLFIGDSRLFERIIIAAHQISPEQRLGSSKYFNGQPVYCINEPRYLARWNLTLIVYLRLLQYI